eukprot:GHVP01028597.1.p1 GENE.GHVP01028597.1~~GHVP01028597.1.p1  ORF type:complete len:140 (-),score=4.05 GHVP01028597.1:691-1110(-)
MPTSTPPTTNQCPRHSHFSPLRLRDPFTPYSTSPPPSTTSNFIPPTTYTQKWTSTVKKRRLPMGLQKSPSILQEILTTHLSPFASNCRNYLDDILIIGYTATETSDIAKNITKHLQNKNWTINELKSSRPTNNPTKILG